jgi:hypothetical protein
MNSLPPYPFDISPPPKIGSKKLNRRDLWDAFEFFRIEALLRSEVVWKLYRQGTLRTKRIREAPPVWNVELWHFLYGQNRLKLKGKTDAHMRRLLHDESLRDRFAVHDGWAVLLGSHHRYLTRDPDRSEYTHYPFWISDGILDLSLLMWARISSLRVQLKDIKAKQSRYSYVRIDNAFAPEANIKALRPVLQHRHKAVTFTLAKLHIDPRTGAHSYPSHPKKDPPITDVSAWLKYFVCYDLSHHGGRTPEEIATQVYGNEESQGEVTTVNQAVSRVRRLIAAALDSNTWPPTSLK